jgi:hypothetical protein
MLAKLSNAIIARRIDSGSDGQAATILDRSSKFVQARAQAGARVGATTVLLDTSGDPSGLPKLDVEGSSPFARSRSLFLGRNSVVLHGILGS